MTLVPAVKEYDQLPTFMYRIELIFSRDMIVSQIMLSTGLEALSSITSVA